jgi:RNA polymerase sigma factor (sigma-70 family)
MPDPRSDEELMRAYCGGERGAFDELFQRYAGLLLRVARRQLETEDQARDVVQETFVRLHAARYDFRQDARLRPWVMTIALNLVREHWRRTKRRKTTSDDTLDTRPGPVPEREPLETRQRAEQVRPGARSACRRRSARWWSCTGCRSARSPRWHKSSEPAKAP